LEWSFRSPVINLWEEGGIGSFSKEGEKDDKYGERKLPEELLFHIGEKSGLDQEKENSLEFSGGYRKRKKSKGSWQGREPSLAAERRVLMRWSGSLGDYTEERARPPDARALSSFSIGSSHPPRSLKRSQVVWEGGVTKKKKR